MTVVVLHISDIHIKTAQDPILKRASEIAACTFSSLHSASQILIVVSGDIAFSGEPDQYDLATEFFDQIKNGLEGETKVPVTFITVPGNHDCDFSLDSGARQIMVKSLEGNNPPNVDQSVIDVCTAVQKPFFEFRNKLEGNVNITDDALWRAHKFDVEGKAIGFECLNVSWVSKKNEDPGRLFFPVQLYQRKNVHDIDLRIVVLHHPLNWFNQSIYRQFRVFVRELGDIVISGHEHQGNVGIYRDAESDESAFVEGCVLQGERDLSDSSFNVVVLDLAKSQFSSTRYVWNDSQYLRTEEGSWTGFRDLPAKRANPFAITENFQEVLDDPGAYFKHPGGISITLSDIYVYPDLRKVEDGDEKHRNFVSARKLLSPEVTADGVLLEGEEKAGCTSLLYQLYLEYHSRGFVPLLLRAKNLRKTTDAEIDAEIRRAVEGQYGAGSVEKFEQLPRIKKLLLLDDFDECPIKATNAKTGLLDALRKRFGHFVTTVNDLFEVRELLNGDIPRDLLTLEHYRIQPLGYALRAKLIERWFSLGTDGTQDQGTLIARCDQAERQINAVMGSPAVPSLPIYLLTLLQTIDAGRTGDFKESALGYYYQYLLTEAFQASGVPPKKLTELFHYSNHLAWEYHVKNKDGMSELELRDFNSRFSKQWHTVDFESRIKTLVNAKVLWQVGDDYVFRYPYIYYYLKGQFLSESLSDIDIRAYISHCCAHLYVRDYANTVLFLAHHTTDDFVLQEIAKALHMSFRTSQPIRLDGDTEVVSRLIESAPALTYSGGTPEKHRLEKNEIQDQLDDGSDGLADSEEDASTLSLIAQITMLFKTTEILGQVLKNQYSKITRARKADLLEELFNGPLRAIRNFYEHLEAEPDALVAEIESAIDRKGVIADKEARNNLARKIAASLVQLISFGFIMRTAQSASADSLLEDVREVVSRNKTLAFELIELGILLDSPKSFPRQKLLKLQRASSKEPVAIRLLHMMILNRLYMFKTSEKDIQWLASEFDLDISAQHNIAYSGSNVRRL